MPSKKSSFSRKSSSNQIPINEIQKNTLTSMFKRIESDSILQECSLCQEKIKTSLFKEHQSLKCKFRTINTEQEIIVLDEDEVSLEVKEDVKDLEEFPKRLKTENFDYVSTSSDTKDSDDQLLQEFVKNLDEKEQVSISNSDSFNSSPTKSFDFYLNNFVNAIESVISEDKFSYLFDKNDLLIVEKFNCLTQQSKILYVRLFQRKFKWLNLENISYDRISTDLNIYLKELVENSFLIDESSICTYEEIIYLFKVPQLKELAKACHISSLNNNQTNKTEIIKTILQHFKTQKSLKSLFNKSKNSSLNNDDLRYMTQCKKILGKCFKLEKYVRGIFVRILILYSLSSSYQADLNDTGQQKFYEQALENEFELLNLIDSKEYEQAFDVFEPKIEDFKSIMLDTDSNKIHSDLPTYLRVFTSGSIYTKLLSIYAFEILQRLKKYKEANDMFEFLLYKQNLYSLSSRSKWFERLAINYETHLKDPLKSFEALKKGLNDHEYVKKSGRLGLFKRLVKMNQTKKYHKLKGLKEEMESLCLKEKYDFIEAPTVEIEGTLLHTSEFIPGRKNVFIQNQSANDPDSNGLTISVEKVALNYYIDTLDYTNGKHAETTTLLTLFGILFWDIIFDNTIYNVFVDKFQHGPLDLQTKDFYLNRKQKINEKLELIKNGSNDLICDLISENWNLYKGIECFGVNWNLFESLEELLSLIKCFTSLQLTSLCDYMCKNLRYCRSGGPDLIIWSTKLNKFKFVEVKGPGDHLSYKQMIWLDFFINNSIDCEVCYVKGLNSKRLRQ